MQSTADSSGTAIQAKARPFQLLPGQQARLAAGEAGHDGVEVALDGGRLAGFGAGQQAGGLVRLHHDQLRGIGAVAGAHLDGDRGGDAPHPALDEDMGRRLRERLAASSAISR